MCGSVYPLIDGVLSVGLGNTLSIKYSIHTGVNKKMGFTMWLFYIDYFFFELPENMLTVNITYYSEIV